MSLISGLQIHTTLDKRIVVMLKFASTVPTSPSVTVAGMILTLNWCAIVWDIVHLSSVSVL